MEDRKPSLNDKDPSDISADGYIDIIATTKNPMDPQHAIDDTTEGIMDQKYKEVPREKNIAKDKMFNPIGSHA